MTKKSKPLKSVKHVGFIISSLAISSTLQLINRFVIEISNAIAISAIAICAILLVCGIYFMIKERRIS